MHKPFLRLLAALALTALLGSFALAQVLVVAQGTDAVTLDPHDATDSPSATVTSHLYETLSNSPPRATSFRTSSRTSSSSTTVSASTSPSAKA